MRKRVSLLLVAGLCLVPALPAAAIPAGGSLYSWTVFDFSTSISLRIISVVVSFFEHGESITKTGSSMDPLGQN